MRETTHFVNDCHGWECKRCRDVDASVREDTSALKDDVQEGNPSSATLARFFREGEAEEREPRLSSSSLARWKDSTRRALVCTRCRIEENLSE